MPVVVLATLHGKPDKRAELDTVLSAAAAASRAEDGCVSYAFARDLEDQDCYRSMEVWRDQAALDAHFHTPHVAELITAMGDLLSGRPVIESYVSP